MNELVEKINLLWDSFSKDADALVTKGNKSAGQRARKTSLELAALIKRVPCSIYRRIKKINFCEKGRTLLFRV